jgi:hypothetical protein
MEDTLKASNANGSGFSENTSRTNSTISGGVDGQTSFSGGGSGGMRGCTTLD